MTDLSWLLIVTIGFHLTSAYSWRKERKELINKIMSRNYHDYQFAQNVERTMRPDNELRAEEVRAGIKVDDGSAEDLAPIQGFGIN